MAPARRPTVTFLQASSPGSRLPRATCVRSVATSRQLAKDGIDWREVVASLRPVTPRLWRALPNAEKARFLRHLRPYWEVHRHRMAPELWNSLQELIAGGTLRIVAARLTSIEATDGALRVSMRRRDAAVPEALNVAAVINCTGPESDVRRLHDPLISDLLNAGLAICDAAGLGIRVDDAYRVITSSGQPSQSLSLTGPLLRGEFWEATAVPELRVHAARLAERLASELV